PYGALLMGRSSSAIKGLIIIPELIDADYTGEIKIMLQTHFPPMMIPAGSRIAQLVLLPQLIREASIDQAPHRGDQGFGSTGGLALLTVPMNTRPVINITLTSGSESIHLKALLDTRADLTIVS
ncbi:DUT nucleotidohydrolase, partial [Chloroceryle aenea]|nr:DUT nucleotidohydrolase [Chloroceryle aenea]